MSSGLPSASKGPPTVFQRPTLGCAVRLGELFDERTSGFLGVQLYAERAIKFAVTNIKQTDLTLSLSNSLEKKANLLDIQANLSLGILSDLVKVEGSASYLNDAKSNSQARSWILALKVRTEERRLLFAEDALSINVLDMVKEDYIAENRATHFVSSIVYGGNLIINMTERATEVTNEESIEGKLGLELEKLKGAVSLKGKAEAKIKDQFKGMDSKFDLVVHGDVELDTVPDKPVDVLDLIPRAAKLLLGNPENGAPKGVPISVTLQPIPNSILNGSPAVSVHRLCQSPINDVFETFSRLEDVRSRFCVLVDGTGVLGDFIPKLKDCVLCSSERFGRVYGGLLQKLAQFLSDMMATGKSDVDMFPRGSPNPKPEEHRHSTDSGSKKSTDLPGSLPSTERHSLLDRAEHLYGFYTGDSHKNPQQGHGERGYAEVEPLSFLEPAFQDFQFFVSDIQREAGGRLGDGGPLSTVVDISRTLYSQFIVHLFIMTPLCLAGADLAVIRILALLRKYNKQPTHILYTEDLSEVEKLPGGEFFSDLQLKKPTYYVGEIDDSGKVSWRLGEKPNPVHELALPDLIRVLSDLPYETVVDGTQVLDARKPFSVVFMAKITPGHPFEGQVALCAHQSKILFTANPVAATCSYGNYLATNLHSSVTVGEQPFVVAFVQDLQQLQAHLYVNGRLENSAQISALTSNDHEVELQFWCHVLLDEMDELSSKPVRTARYHRLALGSTDHFTENDTPSNYIYVVASLRCVAFYDVALELNEVRAIYQAWSSSIDVPPPHPRWRAPKMMTSAGNG